MKIRRAIFAVGLLLLAVFIWLRARSWMQDTADTLPVLCALPLYVWLACPWKWRESQNAVPSVGVLVAALLFMAGVALDLTVLLAASWCLLLWVFLEMYAVEFSRRLLILPFLGFPWIATDVQSLGWWFRFSGAAASETVFHAAGFHVQREGTFLVVQGLPLAVDAACSGLNVLQAMVIAGFAVVYMKVVPGLRFWTALLCLAPLAWLSNTMRILTLGIAALSFGPEFAMGWFHQWGGWVVLCVMFGLCQWFYGRIFGDRESASNP